MWWWSNSRHRSNSLHNPTSAPSSRPFRIWRQPKISAAKTQVLIGPIPPYHLQRRHLPTRRRRRIQYLYVPAPPATLSTPGAARSRAPAGPSSAATAPATPAAPACRPRAAPSPAARLNREESRWLGTVRSGAVGLDKPSGDRVIAAAEGDSFGHPTPECDEDVAVAREAQQPQGRARRPAVTVAAPRRRVLPISIALSIRRPTARARG